MHAIYKCMISAQASIIFESHYIYIPKSQCTLLVRC